MPILNADGIYSATYYGLLLNLKLLRCGYYDSEEKSLPISEVNLKRIEVYYILILFRVV